MSNLKTVRIVLTLCKYQAFNESYPTCISDDETFPYLLETMTNHTFTEVSSQDMGFQGTKGNHDPCVWSNLCS